MADQKSSKIEPQAPVTEGSPNPHNESNITEMPIRTDHREHTGGQNIAQNPSTVEGRLIPSVGEAVARGSSDLDSDSMFNNVDHQTEEIRKGKTEKRKRDKNTRSA